MSTPPGTSLRAVVLPLYTAGYTPREIAAELGCPVRCVYNALKSCRTPEIVRSHREVRQLLRPNPRQEYRRMVFTPGHVALRPLFNALDDDSRARLADLTYGGRGQKVVEDALIRCYGLTRRPAS